MFYYFEIRDTDGNDCRVYDCVVEAENEDKANDEVQASIMAAYPNDEEDGDGGTYHTCDCEQPEEPEDNAADCDQCEVIAINGVNCHETGCPTYAKYLRAKKAFDNFECQGHGGITVSDAQEFETEEQAVDAGARYHSTWNI